VTWEDVVLAPFLHGWWILSLSYILTGRPRWLMNL